MIEMVPDFSLTVDWTWRQNKSDELTIRYHPSRNVQHEATSLIGTEFQNSREIAKQAELLANLLLRYIQTPEPLRVDKDHRVVSVLTKINHLHRSEAQVSPLVQLSAEFSFPPLGNKSVDKYLKIEELSPDEKGLVRLIDSKTVELAYSHFYSRLGENSEVVNRLIPHKRRVFISYRSPWKGRALELFHMLGQFNDGRIFLPRMDAIDMQAGNWIKQLEKMIIEADGFIPLLTKDYRDGPVARQELDLALRKICEDSETKRLVPILVEGSVSDYKNTFLGNFHIYSALGDKFSKEQIRDIASLLLGTSRNPYEV